MFEETLNVANEIEAGYEVPEDVETAVRFQKYSYSPSEFLTERPTTIDLDLSRFRAAPSARLSHHPFEGDWAFP
ncbi:hypothetical protein, partial [Parasedimentitalea huanghaiensis]|uniref:hypothetical protein n=1 Tax=Parasedimentitalea huanghaiensis TaxID=2682100 RepID=UPI001ADADB68